MLPPWSASAGRVQGAPDRGGGAGGRIRAIRVAGHHLEGHTVGLKFGPDPLTEDALVPPKLAVGQQKEVLEVVRGTIVLNIHVKLDFPHVLAPLICVGPRPCSTRACTPDGGHSCLAAVEGVAQVASAGAQK